MSNILISTNPSTGEVLWSGKIFDRDDIRSASERSDAFQSIWEKTSIDERRSIIERFGQLVKDNSECAAKIISEENGKPLWEAKTEVNSLVNKIQVVFDAYEERAQTRVKELPNGRKSVTRYRPHGVLAVLGPFNFPMSMPNSHIMPALYAGNTILFKPSEKVPKSAEFYVDLWRKAGLPDEALQLIVGDASVGQMLIEDTNVKGVLFIGSRAAGKLIEQTAIKNDKLCVLEMGGNSPLVIWDYEDIRAAINITIQSAYISSGQRCSAARRLIVNSEIADEFLRQLSIAIDKIVVGDPFNEHPIPFMGPMVDERAANAFVNEYERLVNGGATILVPTRLMNEAGKAFVRPALLDTTHIDFDDKEIFGPLLQVNIVDNLDRAIRLSNETDYGLAAGIVTESAEIYERFYYGIRAGIVNWNQPLTGSTTIAPFGGIKGSGNYHPAGYLSVDYCVYGCASIESPKACAPATLSHGLIF